MSSAVLDIFNDHTEFSAAFPESLSEKILGHVLRADGQEDLTFALYHPGRGRQRFTALLYEAVLPQAGERIVDGNVSFTPEYFLRALALARERGMGLALLHSHLGPGWQGMSPDDVDAEAGHAGAVAAATGLPFLGLTAGTDGAWSARFWRRVAPRRYGRVDCATVRVVGKRLRITYHPDLLSDGGVGEALERTVGVWGAQGQADLSRLHIGVVGLGSVGSIVSEAVARMGGRRTSLIDYDTIEVRNLDRVLGATRNDVGRLKVDVAAGAAEVAATALGGITVRRVPESVVEEEGYRAALDCDVVFSCVDRPWARRVLNHLAYAHLIPVIDGGILVRVRRERLVGADWHVHAVAPGRRCLECLEAFDASLVGMEQGGALDDPSYLAQLDPGHTVLRHENVFPFSLNVASLEVLQLAAMVLGPIADLGDQNYHFVTGTLDRTEDRGCNPGCLYPPLIATGDRFVCPTGVDPGAKARRVRADAGSDTETAKPD